jgi:imidazolonepropionase-like amidohydrolase
MKSILSLLAGPHPRSLLARRHLRRFPPAARSGRGRFIFAAIVGGLVISAAAPGISQQAAQPKPDKIVHAGRLIDGVANAPRERVSILISGDRIIGIQDGFIPPQGAQVIDLSRATVMPGFIDSHTHITGEGTENAIVKAVTLDAVDDAVRSTAYAKRTLEAGFTTIRNVGAEGGADVALKRAINEGVVPGPRIWTARHTLSITGGHGDQGGLRPDLGHDATWENGIVDSPEEAAKAVRYQHKYGADLIKFTATGGVLSIGDSGDLQQFSDDEMVSIVKTAHLLGMKVAAHAHGKVGIEAAIKAGVDSIEHGTYLDAETIALFKKHGTYLVPTIIAGKTVAEMAKKPGALHPTVREKAAKIGPLIQDSFRRAYAGGVKIAFGTDSGVSNHGDNAREFGYMVEAGMPPIEAILSATRSAADLLGASDRVGSLQAGRFADVIAVSGDPLKDITELQRITFVMKGGIVYKQAAAPAPSTAATR